MKEKYLVILLKELVILPGQEIKVDLATDISKFTVDLSLSFDHKVLVVAPLAQKEKNPSFDDLPKVGVVAHILETVNLSNNSLRILIQGEKRVIINDYFYESDFEDVLKAETKMLELPKFNPLEEDALKRKLKKTVKVFINANQRLSNECISRIENLENLDLLTDEISTFLPFNVLKKLEYMQTINPLVRAQNLLEDIHVELELIKLDKKLEEKVKERLYKNDNNYFLKEKITTLKEELGEVSGKEADVKKFLTLLKKCKLNTKTTKKITEEIHKYERTSLDSVESSILYNYLTCFLMLPWHKKTDEFLDIDSIKNFLDSSHYGLTDVKERIYDYVEIKKISKKPYSPVICIVGPPGVGKTSIASKIAECLNRKFEKISVGGLNDSLELTGSRKTYMGATHGKIIDAIKKADVNNPVILIDEVDKMVKDYKSDPASVLLEILEQKENSNFTDNYIEEPFDLSSVLFILTANNEEDIPYVLRDRLEMIYIDGYASYEKEKIAKNYIIPKICEHYEVPLIKIKDDIIEYVIKNYTDEAGVRELERIFNKLVRRVIINDIKLLNLSHVKKFLPNPIYRSEKIFKYTAPGIVNTLASCMYSGVITNLEIIKFKGSGNFKITGNIGKVMDESVMVALSFIRANYKVNLDKHDYHLHFLSGGISKDGPSAGLAITCALLSVSLEKSIDLDIAFTGEISLNGKIIAVGAVKEKVLAAINNDIKVVYLPKDNEPDLKDIPKDILSKITIKFVSDFDEVYKVLFTKDSKED